MIITTKQKLFPEEEQMPLAKYYHDYPLYGPTPLEQQIIDGGPMKLEDAIMPENFLDLLKPTGYDKVEMGYCMFPDGSGYVATYRLRPPHITNEMEMWFRHWRNNRSKSMIPGHGNLRYKIWNPADHFDHYYVNWVDGSQGVHTRESLDLGQGDRQYDTIRHQFDVRDYGFTEEKMEELKAAGINFNGKGSYETFDEPGTHLCLSITRSTPFGAETRSREWIGWRPVNGKLVRDEKTYCTEEYLKKVVIHTVVEWNHLNTFLPDLYEEYKDQPFDAD